MLYDQIYVSFSGGKDSTVLLDLVRRVFPDTPAVFMDTGLEFPELREFVKTVDNVIWLKPKMNFRKVIENFGYPVISKRVSSYVATAKRNPDSVRAKYLRGEIGGKIFGFNNGKYAYLIDAPFKCSDYCCNVLKKQPSHKFAKENDMHPIIGTMATESIQRRNDWLKNGCNAFDSEEPKSKPMSFWTEQDVLAYIKRYNLTYASVYGEILQDKYGKYYTTGLDRTGCMFCMFGCHLEKEPNRFQRLKITHPKVWEFCMKPWDKGGLGMREVLEYIGVKTE